MFENQDNRLSVEAKSGFSNVQTLSGQTVRIFALTADDFERLKPTEDVFDRAAAIIADNKSDMEAREAIDQPLSNEERFRRLIQG